MNLLAATADAANDGWTWVPAVVLASGAVLGWATLWMSRRNQKDENQSDKRQTDIEEFGVVGDLAMQITDRVLEKVLETQVAERHDCDEKIESLRRAMEDEHAEMRAAIDDCHNEREEFKRLLQENGLLPDVA